MQFKLRDICKLITKGSTPSTLGFDFVSSGINFVKSEQLINTRSIYRKNNYFISDEANIALKRSILKENDILISIAGAYLGKLAIVDKTILPANTNQAVGIIRLNEDINPLFVFYLLSTDKMKHEISAFNSQSAQPNINLTQLGEINISLPDIATQNHIVNTISFLLLKSL